MPGLSTNDRDDIRSFLRDRKVFVNVADGDALRHIEVRLLTCKRIATLHSFAKDTVFLDICYGIMRDLLSSQWKVEPAMRGEYMRAFVFSAEHFQANYIELWLAAMRHFPDLSDHRSANVRKDKGRPRPPCRIVERAKMAQLACSAYHLGFRTEAIEAYRMQGPDAPELEMPCTEAPALVTDLKDVHPRDRCGRPLETDFLYGQKYLFLRALQGPAQPSTGRYVTWFAVARQMISSFWATAVDEPGTDNEPRHDATPRDEETRTDMASPVEATGPRSSSPGETVRERSAMDRESVSGDRPASLVQRAAAEPHESDPETSARNFQPSVSQDARSQSPVNTAHFASDLQSTSVMFDETDPLPPPSSVYSDVDSEVVRVRESLIDGSVRLDTPRRHRERDVPDARERKLNLADCEKAWAAADAVRQEFYPGARYLVYSSAHLNLYHLDLSGEVHGQVLTYAPGSATEFEDDLVAIQRKMREDRLLGSSSPLPLYYIHRSERGLVRRCVGLQDAWRSLHNSTEAEGGIIAFFLKYSRNT